MNAVTNYDTLAGYRRAVSEMYARVRNSDKNQKERWSEFCRGRDNLFATHPQSALSMEQRTVFKGLRYYPYNPSLRYCLTCLLYTSPSPRDRTRSRMPSSA